MTGQLLLPSGEGKSMGYATTKKDEKKKISPIFKTGLDILNHKSTHKKFLVEPILPSGTICFLSGPSDTGKSILSRQIAISVALGHESVIGMPLNLVHNKAIVICTEDDIDDWKDKLNIYGLSTAEKSIENLFVVFEPEKCNFKELHEMLKSNPVDLIVVDVFSDIFEGNLNDAIDVRKFLKPFTRLMQEFGCTFLFLHHITKSGQKSDPSKLNLSGSQALEAKARCVLEIRADVIEQDVRLLSIVKNNRLSPKEKSQVVKLKLNGKLEFENVGSTSLQNVGKKISHSHDEAVISMILEEEKKGTSLRDTEKKLANNGTPLGRTKISEIRKSRPLTTSAL